MKNSRGARVVRERIGGETTKRKRDKEHNNGCRKVRNESRANRNGSERLGGGAEEDGNRREEDTGNNTGARESIGKPEQDCNHTGTNWDRISRRSSAQGMVELTHLLVESSLTFAKKKDTHHLDRPPERRAQAIRTITSARASP